MRVFAVLLARLTLTGAVSATPGSSLGKKDLSSLSPAADPDPETLGASIYLRGVGRDGRDITGRVGRSNLALSGAAVACTNCHGADARGGGEAFLQAPDIRGYTLTKPHGSQRPNGVVRSHYDEASLAIALRTGEDPDSRMLDAAMPRFDLADDEITALMAYLQSTDAGAKPLAPRPLLGLLIPREEEPLAEALREGLQNCPLAGPHQQTTSYHQPPIRVLRYDNAAQAAQEIAALNRSGELAALIAPYLIGREQSFATAFGSSAVPLLFPISLFEPDWAKGVAPHFQLPGIETQALALLNSLEAPDKAGEKPVLLLRFDRANAGSEAIAGRVQDDAAARGWQVHLWPESEQAAHRASALITLTPMPAVSELSEPPDMLLVPSAFVRPTYNKGWRERGTTVRVALPYPPLPGDAPELLPPVTAWTAIACELISQLPPLPASREQLPHWRKSLQKLPQLSLSPWLTLPYQSSPTELIQLVYLLDSVP